MERPIALITPTHRADRERFALLCESIDRRLTGYERHYVIVNDDDMELFAEFAGPRRVILPCSRFLPRWLRLVPPFLMRNGRRVWWSFRSRPVHGWHIQQMLKIAAVLQLPEQRFCIVDSDNVIIRRFDIGAYAGGARSPLYIARGAISADAPLHAKWIANGDRLLGLPPSSFPADDHIGNLIVWDKDAVRAMTRAIEDATGVDWFLALCRTRAFSEYLLYGQFVRHSPRLMAAHEIVPQSLAVAYWDEEPLDRAGLATLLDGASTSKIALCVESFSRTPVQAIREAAGLALPAAASPFAPRLAGGAAA
ncbi:hypothetical protein A1351_21600 [Methylosinus sp. R-45379]|jgi:hypothetical protein|uniref:DUF6492 family protein n=1 Tax=unclassified Methylosinus TaxID=2624500 RepID=UPI000465BCEC|nr:MULTISPECIES: DUF6492 family protein [unclassified Methylosinus]OAI31466.1 hypothetical protein A1351_21600 [Methylosinus sp. R-45379]TDX65569.1 hypothetical protein EDE12_10254 [Methylosinus sp. sav-2]